DGQLAFLDVLADRRAGGCNHPRGVARVEQHGRLDLVRRAGGRGPHGRGDQAGQGADLGALTLLVRPAGQRLAGGGDRSAVRLDQAIAGPPTSKSTIAVISRPALVPLVRMIARAGCSLRPCPERRRSGDPPHERQASPMMTDTGGCLYRAPPMSRPFLKMNGLGNDFVVVEARSAPFAPSLAEARA